jgi:hypothetical protein
MAANPIRRQCRRYSAWSWQALLGSGQRHDVILEMLRRHALPVASARLSNTMALGRNLTAMDGM